MRAAMAVALCALLALSGGERAWSQPAQTNVIQMRPDEAFWNAIRDSTTAQSFDLFLKTYPNSPYAAEAKERLDKLQGAGEPPSGAPQAAAPKPAEPPASASPPPAEASAPAAPQASAPSEAKLTGEAAIVDSLRRLGFLKDAAATDLESDEVDTAFLFYKFMMDFESDDPKALTPGQIEEMVQLAQIGEVMRGHDVSGRLAVSFVERARTVYEQIAGGKDKPAIPDLISALQRHYGEAATGKLDEGLLQEILRQEIRLPETKVDEDSTLFGDWLFSHYDNNWTRFCRLLVRNEAIVTRGAYLSEMMPRPVIIHNIEPGSSSLSITVARGDLFAHTKPVFLRSGNRSVEIVQKSNAFDLEPSEDGLDSDNSEPEDYYPRDYVERKSSNGTIRGDTIIFLKNAPENIVIHGQSPYGGDLVIEISSKGFTKAFQTMSKACADGRLNVWLK